jgi:selenocysteine lyase/cysteine desulfurase
MALVDPFLPDERKLDAIRDLLPSLASGIRLDTTVAGPFPAETDRALRQLAEHEQRVGRGGPELADDRAQRAEEARSVIAAVLTATPDHVLLAPGPAAALSAALAARRGNAPGGLVLIGALSAELEAASVALAAAHGLPVVRDPSDIPEGATLVVAAHVDTASGRVVDAPTLATRAHDAGAPLVLDMSWSAGAFPVDAPGSGSDLVVADAHRWLLGPEGVTALWVADRRQVDRLAGLLDPLPAPLLLGVARSVGWLLMYVSLPWAWQRAETLTTRLRSALTSVEGVELLATIPSAATVLPFRITGWPATEAAAELGRRVFAQLDVDAPRDLLRAAVGAWLREDEIDRFAVAVGELAAHTPETLPRRPLLTILEPVPWDER